MKLKDELCYIEVAAIQARSLDFFGLAEAFDRVAEAMRSELDQNRATELQEERHDSPANPDRIGPESPFHASLAAA